MLTNKKYGNSICKGLMLWVFAVCAGLVHGQTSNGTGGGDASNPSTWGGTDQSHVPSIFGGTSRGDITITRGDTVTYVGLVTHGTAETLTIEAGAILIIDGDFETNNNKSTMIIINGLFVNSHFHIKMGTATLDSTGRLVTNGIVYLDPNGSVQGSGTVYALSVVNRGTLSTDIDLYTSFKNWTGTNSTEWEVDNNWSPSGVPLPEERVLFDPLASNMPLLSSSVTIKSMFIDSAQSLTVASTGALTIDSFLINNGTVSILSAAADATGSLVPGKSYEGSGIVNVERFLPSAGWHFISSPISGQSLDDFATGQLKANDTLNAIADYIESTDTWNYNTDGDVSAFVAAKGYSISRNTSAGVVTFSGTSINTGVQTLNLSGETGVGPGYGWNLVGNPYTSALITRQTNGFLADSVNQLALADTHEGIYMWDQSLGDYRVVSGVNIGLLDTTNTIKQDEIAVGQGFFVKSASVAAEVQFTPSMQIHMNNALFKSAERPVSALQLRVSTDVLKNTTTIAFVEGKGSGLDPGYDVGKFKGNPDIALYSQLLDGNNDVDFAIQTLANTSYESLSIPIGLDLKGGGNATFTLESTAGFPESAVVYLEDTELGNKTILNPEGAAYTVALPDLKGYGRFNLLITAYTGNEATTRVYDMNKTGYKVYLNNNTIVVRGDANQSTRFEIYGIDGRMWYQNMAEASNISRISTESLPNGIYLLRIEGKGKSETHKFVIVD